MDKIRAVVVDHGAPGHLAVKDVDAPVPLPNEALVRVAATSLNLGEVRYAQSMEPGSRIGWDLAGTVEKAAADGSGPKEGARVVGFLPRGAWSQLAAVPVESLAELPENVSFADAATLPVAGLTALYVLERGTGLLGRRVLVTGANGGVGLFSCQLAEMMGAHVVAQIRREQYRDLVMSMGAKDVVVSEDGGAACNFAPYRLISEGVGGQVLANSLQMLSSDGICVAFAYSAGSEITFDAIPLLRAGRAKLYGFLLFNELGIEPAGEGLARLAGLVSEDRLKAFISVEDDWSKIGEVAKDLWERKIPGKAVLNIS